jgi:AcrR family transcriptional regulator
MSSPPDQAAPVLGLRERKKLRTRAAIREHALRLFREQGYAHTTVEQIAEAAEVSPSTFFRYFPTKEDVVMADDIDPVMIAAFNAEPPDTPPLRALRNAFKRVYAELEPEQLEQERARTALITTVPELQGKLMQNLTSTVRMLSEAVAARVGRPEDDLAVRTLVGVVLGVGLATMHVGDDERPFDVLIEQIDAGLALVEQGLPL